jgi:hypothetical protein
MNVGVFGHLFLRQRHLLFSAPLTGRMGARCGQQKGVLDALPHPAKQHRRINFVYRHINTSNRVYYI